MINTTLSFYLSCLYKLQQKGLISNQQMHDLANIIFDMVQDGFTIEHAEDIFNEIYKEIGLSYTEETIYS